MLQQLFELLKLCSKVTAFQIGFDRKAARFRKALLTTHKKELIALLRVMPLQHLELLGFSFEEPLREICDLFPNLVTLRCGEYVAFGLENPIELFTGKVHLEHIQIKFHDDKPIDKFELHKFLRQTNFGLKSFDTSHHALEVWIIELLAQFAPNLQRLHFHGIAEQVKEPEKFFAAVAKLTKLRHVKILSAAGIYSHFSLVLAKCIKLRTIELFEEEATKSAARKLAVQLSSYALKYPKRPILIKVYPQITLADCPHNLTSANFNWQ